MTFQRTNRYNIIYIKARECMFLVELDIIYISKEVNQLEHTKKFELY